MIHGSKFILQNDYKLLYILLFYNSFTNYKKENVTYFIKIGDSYFSDY